MRNRKTVEIKEDLHKILRANTTTSIKKEVDRILRKELINNNKDDIYESEIIYKQIQKKLKEGDDISTKEVDK